MEKIKIVTDSACDLDRELADKYSLEIIPIPVQIGNQNYKDGFDITNKEFYDKLKKSDQLPTTSQITPYTFKERFTKLLTEYDSIIYISFSSQLSGIYNSATMAASMVNNEKIEVIDTKAASLGLGLIALKAAELAQSNNDKSEIITKVEEMIANIKHIFGVGSLDMLKKGGRISAPAAYIGNLLHIIPILEVNKAGEIVPLSKARGEKKFYHYLLNYIKNNSSDLSEQRIGISHADCYQKADKLRKMIEDKFEVGEILITKIGAAVGSHTGRGTLTLFFNS